MGGDLSDLEVLHELLGGSAATDESEAHHAARAVGQVLLGELVPRVGGQAGVLHEADLGMLGEELRHRLAVLAMPRHANVQALEAEVQVERVLRRLDAAEVAHELRGRLGDVGAGLAELLGVDHTVVGLVGRREAGILVRVGIPVEVAGIHDGSAHGGAVAVHVLGGRMRHDVGAPLDRTAHDRRGERVVDDQGHAVRMRGVGETLDIEHVERGVGDRLAEDRLGVGLERRLELLVSAVGGHERALDAHALHGVRDEVVRAAVDGGARHHVISLAQDVEQREEVRRLAGARQHASGTALELGDLCRNGVVGGVLQTGVEISRLLEVEQTTHVLGRIVLPRRRLVDGDLTGLTVAGTIAALHAGRSKMLCHALLLLLETLRR